MQVQGYASYPIIGKYSGFLGYTLMANIPWNNDGKYYNINRLFAYCKGGHFDIHIWVWFGYFIC